MTNAIFNKADIKSIKFAPANENAINNPIKEEPVNAGFEGGSTETI